jgi:hypothetical protein
VIDSLNALGPRSVLVIDSNPHPLMVHDQLLYDTNGDYSITSVDALRIVNQLNAGDAGAGEGEAIAEGEALVDLFVGPRRENQIPGSRASVSQVTDQLADAVIAQSWGDEYRTAPTLSSSGDWRDRVESLFAADELSEESDADDDLFGLLN